MAVERDNFWDGGGTAVRCSATGEAANRYTSVDQHSFES
jgi:hypothetical protein